MTKESSDSVPKASRSAAAVQAAVAIFMFFSVVTDVVELAFGCAVFIVYLVWGVIALVLVFFLQLSSCMGIQHPRKVGELLDPMETRTVSTPEKRITLSALLTFYYKYLEGAQAAVLFTNVACIYSILIKALFFVTWTGFVPTATFDFAALGNEPFVRMFILAYTTSAIAGLFAFLAVVQSLVGFWSYSNVRKKCGCEQKDA